MVDKYKEVIMENLSTEQKQKLLSNPNVLYHFVIYLGTKDEETWIISSITLATDQGKLPEKVVKEKILQQKKYYKDLTIAALVITNKIHVAQGLFENFKLLREYLDATGKNKTDIADLRNSISLMKHHFSGHNAILN